MEQAGKHILACSALALNENGDAGLRCPLQFVASSRHHRRAPKEDLDRGQLEDIDRFNCARQSDGTIQNVLSCIRVLQATVAPLSKTMGRSPFLNSNIYHTLKYFLLDL